MCHPWLKQNFNLKLHQKLCGSFIIWIGTLQLVHMTCFPSDFSRFPTLTLVMPLAQGSIHLSVIDEHYYVAVAPKVCCMCFEGRTIKNACCLQGPYQTKGQGWASHFSVCYTSIPIKGWLWLWHKRTTCFYIFKVIWINLMVMCGKQVFLEVLNSSW